MEVTIAPLSAIPVGEGRTFEVGNRRLAVFRSRQGRVFATQAECPHRGGLLADGLIGDCKLICPLHAWKFDLRTGRALLGESCIQTYPVRLSGNQQIVVELGEADAP
jgi:nitrite reductase (NADH) small subunit